ncbi:hypothetical protein QFC21_000588 [Naganishia friedmannii]|uniref:Uncharacterized protein n=1 Tax=Naganishia friedmannii TaxID=89922 RepID=A0ACC2WDI6_9TREE|nr:hypothetical protein QFC21_000588 [Naganishia friedmannii]
MSYEEFLVDQDLPICKACMTQYPAPRTDCPICLDPRQFVPPTGQAWTSLRKLTEEKHTNKIVPDEQDERFYSTSLTWARCLKVPLIIASADKHWFQRLSEVKEGEVEWFDNEAAISDEVNVIQCGGHFPGSAVLHWDRSLEPEFASDKHCRTGIILCSDTAMVQPTQLGFTFQWSVPNMIPLNPHEMKGIADRLGNIPFEQATSTWPHRFIRKDARKVLLDSIRKQIHHMGLVEEGGKFRVGSKSEMEHERVY